MKFSKELIVAVESAYLAGNLIEKNVGKLKSSGIRKKAISDYVTDLDKKSENIIIKRINKHFPDHSIYSEEAGKISSKSGSFRWIIDPIDGTTNFIHGYPFFSVSIALEKDNVLIAGVVHDPIRKEYFIAEKGRGSYLAYDGDLKKIKKIKVAKAKYLSECLITTGFPFRIKNQLDVYLKSFKRIFLKCAGLRRTGSAALDLCYTACGRADGFWEMSLSPWDIAAGSLIIIEAGGRVSDFQGEDHYMKTGNIIAANLFIHPQLTRIIKKIFGYH